MKIVAHTPTELIIRDSAMMLRAFGAFVVALGAFAVWVGMAQDPDGRVAVVPMAIGTLIATGGLGYYLLNLRRFLGL